jgi:hypothetical protein
MTYRLLFSLALVSGLGVLGEPVAAADDIDIKVFVNELAPYGQWIDSGQYGRAWIPSGMPGDWRPYTDGRWAWTEDHGWTWVSNHEWGWAPFHYGRWANDARHGWMWIPGTQWAPAWVAWRADNSHVGWAPLPPEVRWRGNSSLRLNSNAANTYIPGNTWLFVDRQRFIEPEVRHYLLPQPTVLTLIPATRSITHYAMSNGRIVNRSLDLSSIERVLGLRVPRLRVTQVDSFDDYKVRRGDAKQVYVYQPGRKAKKTQTSLVQVPVEKPRMERPGKPLDRKHSQGRQNRDLKSQPSLDKQRGKDVRAPKDPAKSVKSPADHGREKNNRTDNSPGKSKSNAGRSGHMKQ